MEYRKKIRLDRPIHDEEVVTTDGQENYKKNGINSNMEKVDKLMNTIPNLVSTYYPAPVLSDIRFAFF